MVEDCPELTYTEGSPRSALAAEGLWLQLHEHVMDARHERQVGRGMTAQSSWSTFKVILPGGI